MSHLKQKQQNKGTTLGGAVADLNALLTQRGSEIADRDSSSLVVSSESLTPAQESDLVSRYTNVEADIKTSLESLSDDGVEVSEAGIEAATIVAMASRSPLEYANAATNTAIPSQEGYTVISPEAAGVAGTIDLRDQVGLEAFDEQALTGHIAHSIAYNAMAATQDDFGESFYKTVVLTPNQPGLEIEIERLMVMNELRRSTAGNVTDFGKVSLINAYVDHTILADEVNEVVPVVLPADENADKFVDAAKYPVVVRKIHNEDIQTAPLKIGTELDLIGISMGTGIVDGQMGDMTDSLDAHVSIKSLVIEITNALGDTSSVLEIDTSVMHRNAFIPSVEGASREMHLNFPATDIVLDANTKDIANVSPAAISSLTATTNVARLKVKLNGDVNLETGSLTVGAGAVTIESLVDENGVVLSTTSGAGKTIADDLNVTVLGYTVKATRSNINRRHRGQIIESDSKRQRHTIPLGAPITALTPVSSDTSASDLKKLVACTRARITNNAVTALLNYLDILRTQVGVARAKGTVPNVPGIGRYLVNPYFEERTLNVATAINSISTHEKRKDLSALLVDTIREIAYRMYEDTNYQAALEVESGGATRKPKLVIGTDPVLQQHLMVTGEERTAGIGMDFKITSSSDTRMKDTIVLTFVRDGKTGPDPLSFGTNAYIPELTSTYSIKRDGSTVNETQVQPRNLHINHLPVAAVLHIEGITELLGGKA